MENKKRLRLIHNESSMKPAEIAILIAKHMDGCSEAMREEAPLYEFDQEPISLGDYLKFCNACLPVEEVLPDELLQQRLEYLKEDSKLKIHFPAGTRCCITVLPVTPRGIKFDDADLQKGNFQTALIIDEEGTTINGFGIAPSHIFSLLPKEIQEQCTFDIGPYDEEDLVSISGDDRSRIIEAYEKAFRAAQKLFNQG